MSWKNIKLILAREIRDQLRDRRTLFMVAILPLLLYPAMGIGMVQMTVLFTEQPRTVVFLNSDQLPDDPPLIDEEVNRIHFTWFDSTPDADTLKVITDQTPTDTVDEEQNEFVKEVLAEAEKLREPATQRQQTNERKLRANQKVNLLTSQIDEAEAERQKEGTLEQRRSELKTQIVEWKSQRAELDELVVQWENELEKLDERIAGLLAECQFQVLVVVADGFAEKIETVNAQLRERQLGARADDYYVGLGFFTNKADEKSLIAFNRVNRAIKNWGEKILNDRLAAADLPQTIVDPVNTTTVDVAQDEEISANLWSKLFPALLVIMAVTGAFYPAVDVAAGEKERGTMETLLICPATRSEIVIGKFLTVMAFSVCTALLNLISMGLTGKYMASIVGSRSLSQIGDLSLPGFDSLIWVFILLIPLAALFSALCLALATFARSSKEGQYYLTPLLMVTLGLTVVTLSPGVELEPFYSVMPVVGPALLLKALLSSPGDPELMVYAIPVLVTSVGYSLLALWWAIDQFASEDVLFREAERFELGLWIRHILRDKDETPSFTEAGFCYVLIMLVSFASLKYVTGSADQQVAAADASEAEQVAAIYRIMKLQMTYLIVAVACPAMFMGLLLTRSPRKTFRLYWPKLKYIAAALLLPLMCHPLVSELMANMQWFFRQLPDHFQETMAGFQHASIAVWFTWMVMAVTPAICEEVAFRGFILSGFSESRRFWLAIVLSSLTFGVVHMIPQQVFYATLLGIPLGVLAIRSNSLLPPIIFHLVFNSISVVGMRFSEKVDLTRVPDLLMWEEKGAIRYGWGTLAITAIIVALLMRWLIVSGGPLGGGRKAESISSPEVPAGELTS